MTEYFLMAAILIISITMAMVGKGGGNFYVIAIVLSGVSMHQAASSSQAIMLATSLAAMLVFMKSKKIDWKLALIIDPATDVMAFVGGYFSSRITGTSLKTVFAICLILVSIFMLIKVKEKPISKTKRFGYWHREFGGYKYTVNLWIALPITALVGLFAGAVGISGGAFKIPLMVMLCGIPIEIAIGTSSAMVAVTALMGLLGHSLNGNFDINFAIPLVILALIGGLIGGKLALRNKPKNLKVIFALTNLIAAIVMLINIFS
ncbi:MAG: sulfite exporter TauE/SafE family protein [Candidatus Izemoplasmatales bacterium]|nr:sulfite exporter TauE/SafE family protein [Candidatus Izemoplasmatales bacterium]